MSVVKTVHHGGIKKDNNIVEFFSASSRPELIKKIDDWFFDYHYIRKEPITKLPALDDWTHSTEDNSCWYISIEGLWEIWIRHESLEFR